MTSARSTGADRAGAGTPGAGDERAVAVASVVAAVDAAEEDVAVAEDAPDARAPTLPAFDFGLAFTAAGSTAGSLAADIEAASDTDSAFAFPRVRLEVALSREVLSAIVQAFVSRISITPRAGVPIQSGRLLASYTIS